MHSSSFQGLCCELWPTYEVSEMRSSADMAQESNGIEFFSIGGDPEALMAYMVKNPGLLPNMQSLRAGDIGKRRKEMAELIDGTWRSCIEAGDGMGEKIPPLNVDAPEDLFIADVIIANPPSMGHIHCAEKLGIPLHIVFTMPWSPTRAFHHPLAAMEYGEVEVSMANYFSFSIMELLTWQGLGDIINKFRTQTLRLDAISPLWGHQLIPRLRVPYSYLWSQALIPRPSDWGDHISITGFSFLKAGSDYTPPQDLADFLAKGPPPVYIGFGSIVVDDPVGLTKLILEAVKLANVRAIVSKGWGGVGGGEVPDDVYLIGNCPHDWLFQRVSCVVHHGGAGTTAAGIALGKPTVVVPFFGDQPFWGQVRFFRDGLAIRTDSLDDCKSRRRPGPSAIQANDGTKPSRKHNFCSKGRSESSGTNDG